MHIHAHASRSFWSSAPMSREHQSAAWEGRSASLHTATGSGMSKVGAEQGAEVTRQGAVESPDPITQRTCFLSLSKLAEVQEAETGLWGVADSACEHRAFPSASTANPRPGSCTDSACTWRGSGNSPPWPGPRMCSRLQPEDMPPWQAAPQTTQEFGQAL